MESFIEATNDKMLHFLKRMNSSSSNPEAEQVIEIAFADRWQVYRRLQELGISCQCRTNQPLSVKAGNVVEAIQLWSVVRQLTLGRRELASWLERCWQIHD